MANTKNTEHKAYELAHEIVKKELSISDLERLVSENCDYKHPQFKRLLTMLNPNYSKDSKAFSDECPGKLVDLHWQEVNAYGYASFYLGFAAGMRLALGERSEKKGVRRG